MPLALYPLFEFRRLRFRRHPWWGEVLRDHRAEADALLEWVDGGGTLIALANQPLGAIAPLEGKGPQDLKIESLVLRIKDENIQEVIIATDSDNEGEATALYLAKVIKPTGAKISRIGLGLPVGSNLEYADPATLSMALESRRLV